MNKKVITNPYLEKCLRPSQLMTKEEYNSLNREERKMIKFITPFFIYDQNYNYRLCL